MKSDKVKVKNYAPFTICKLKGKNCKKVLNTGMDILDEIDSTFMIGGGTLLGFIREAGFIPYDTDIDIDLFIREDEDYNQLVKDMLPKFEKEGYELIRTQEYEGKLMQIAFNHKETNIIFDIYLYYLDWCEDFINVNEHGILIYPFSFYKSRRGITVNGTLYNVPLDFEGYLNKRYGSGWKVPVTEHDSWETHAGCLLIEL